MSEIIEVLTPYMVDCPTFTVDNKKKKILPIVTEWPPIYRSANLNSGFQNIDSLIILSLGFILPEGFVLASKAWETGLKVPSSTFGLRVYKEDDHVNAIGTLPGMPSNYGLLVPMENYEMYVNIFIV